MLDLRKCDQNPIQRDRETWQIRQNRNPTQHNAVELNSLSICGMPHDETFYSQRMKMPIELNEKINIDLYAARTICRLTHVGRQRRHTRGRLWLVSVGEWLHWTTGAAAVLSPSKSSFANHSCSGLLLLSFIWFCCAWSLSRELWHRTTRKLRPSRMITANKYLDKLSICRITTTWQTPLIEQMSSIASLTKIVYVPRQRLWSDQSDTP